MKSHKINLDDTDALRDRKLLFDTSLAVFKAKKEGRRLIPLREEGRNIPFIAIPGVFFYYKLASLLDKDQPFYCFEPGIRRNVEEAAAYYVRELKSAIPHGPYCLGGYCDHGMVVLEMAHQLVTQGEEVPMVVFFEFYSPDVIVSRISVEYMRHKIRLCRDGLAGLTARNKFRYLVKEMKKAANLVYTKITQWKPHSIKRYPGKVTLIRSSTEMACTRKDAYMGWLNYFSGSVQTFCIEGTHSSIFNEPDVIKLAERLDMVLSAVNAPASETAV